MARIKKFHLPDCSGNDCECLWELDYRPLGMNGSRRRVRFKTRKQAERFLSETTHKAARGEYVEPAKVPTFAEVAERWFQGMADLRPSHVVDLRSRLDKHLLPILGPKRMDAISVALLEKLRDDLRASGYASATVNRILQIAAAVFRVAIKHGQCVTNPLDRVDRARKATQEIKPGSEGSGDVISPDSVLSPAGVRRLLDAAEPGFDRTLYLTAFVTGAREGELFALRWTDLELPKEGPGQIYIRRSLSWAHPKGEPARPRFFPPKTRAGLRVIAIPPDLAAALKRWKLQCPPSPDELVFPRRDGQPMYRERMLRKGFYPALARARLRRVTFHSLRHSCASAMIAAGAPVTEVQHHLGHANPAITLAVYSHWFKHADSGAAVARLAEAVLGNRSAPAFPESQGEWAESGHQERDLEAEVVTARKEAHFLRA